MISNERRWPNQNSLQSQPYFARPYVTPKPSLRETTLASREVRIERKYFLLILKENARGRFLRISEDVGGRMNSIMVPVEGLRTFRKLVEEMSAAEAEVVAARSKESPEPPKTEPAA